MSFGAKDIFMLQKIYLSIRPRFLSHYPRFYRPYPAADHNGRIDQDKPAVVLGSYPRSEVATDWIGSEDQTCL